MTNLHDNLKKLTSDVHLTAGEKRLLKQNLLTYMEHKPLRDGRDSNPTFTWFEFAQLRFVMPATLVAVLFVSGGLSYAAEGAIPGDVLYPVKVYVNEEVQGALTFTEEDTLAWNIRRAERRLEEAVALAASGELSTDAQETLAARFEEHASEVAEQVAEYTKDPTLALETNSQFGASLTAHSEAIERAAASYPVAKDEADKLLAHVNETATRLALGDAIAFSNDAAAKKGEEISLFSLKAEPTTSADDVPGDVGGSTTISDDPQAGSATETMSLRSKAVGEVESLESEEQDKAFARRLEVLLEDKYDRARELSERYEENLTEVEHGYVDKLLNDLKMGIAEGKELVKEERYSEAVLSYRTLLLPAMRIEVYLRTAGQLGAPTIPLPTDSLNSEEEPSTEENSATSSENEGAKGELPKTEIDIEVPVKGL